MGYNYAEAFHVNELQKLDPSSPEYQLAEELTMTAVITYRNDFGAKVTIRGVDISTKAQVVTVKGYDESFSPCIGLYSFKELGFSI